MFGIVRSWLLNLNRKGKIFWRQIRFNFFTLLSAHLMCFCWVFVTLVICLYLITLFPFYPEFDDSTCRAREALQHSWDKPIWWSGTCRLQQKKCLQPSRELKVYHFQFSIMHNITQLVTSVGFLRATGQNWKFGNVSITIKSQINKDNKRKELDKTSHGLGQCGTDTNCWINCSCSYWGFFTCPLMVQSDMCLINI